MVSVVDTTTQATTTTGGPTSTIGSLTIHWEIVIPFIIIGTIIVIVLLIVMWIINKIIKKIRTKKKILTSLEFSKYTLDLKNAHMNKNQRFKYKSPLFLWLLFKKAKIYARTSEGKKFIGYYDGELVKKEGYFVMAVELRHSFFKREIDLVIFPYELKKNLILFNDDFTIDLECEGIDEVLSSEYFSIPVFKDTSNAEKKKIFTDFSDDIRKNYYENYSYRQVLKENMNDFALNVKEATEMNASVPYQRKTGND